MADAPAPSIAPNPAGLDVRAGLAGMMRGDVALAAGIMAILVMLILPLPGWLLDIALAISMSFSVLVLMTALFIRSPLEFTSFPAVLLIATMLRLGLNIASTRLILTDGNQGPDAAGDVIAAFGAFVMQGNPVIGAIVFIILVIVNFVVITKGSGRIAEVAARFTLDAMPGKQMAIDADLSAGLITEDVARQRRKELEAESNFFGAMDGASKFVRGDAMAGILITGINIVAGILIGVAQHQMPLGQAGSTYTTLTIGDGLVSQIPSLIVSIAAGLLVSKAGVEGAADQALGKQLTGYPHALIMVSAICLIIGLLPGMPIIPFFALSGLTGYGAYALSQRREARAIADAAAEAVEAAEAEAAEPEEEPIGQTLAIDDVKLELGYGLLPLINDLDGRKLTDQVKALRRQLALDMGFVMPPVRILDNLQLSEDSYAIRIKEIEAGAGVLKIHQIMVMDPGGGAIDMAGEHCQEPAFGLPAMWIDESLREEATFRGYTIVDPATVLATHLTEILREHMPELLSFSAMEQLLAELPEDHKKLLEDISPALISRAGIQRVLQALLKERVTIRDLPTILEAIAEAGSTDTVTITEHVRTRLARQLCWTHRAPDGALPIVSMSPPWEEEFATALIGDGPHKQLALPPTKLHEFIEAVRAAFDAAAQAGDSPVLLTSPLVRPYVRSLVERFRNQTVVMSQNEIHPGAKLRAVGQI